MSPANAKDHARCTSRGCRSLLQSALSVRHGRWRLVGLRSAAIGQAAAAVGRDRGLMRGVRARPSAAGRRPVGKGQVAWLQPDRKSMLSAGSISAARRRCGSRINYLFVGAYRLVGDRSSWGYADTWRHNSTGKVADRCGQTLCFQPITRLGTRGFCSSYAATWQHSRRDATEGRGG